MSGERECRSVTVAPDQLAVIAEADREHLGVVERAVVLLVEAGATLPGLIEDISAASRHGESMILTDLLRSAGKVRLLGTLVIAHDDEWSLIVAKSVQARRKRTQVTPAWVSDILCEVVVVRDRGVWVPRMFYRPKLI
jgi:hypothetical protein